MVAVFLKKWYPPKVFKSWFSDHILTEKFYRGLDPVTQSIANKAADGCFMDKSYTRVTNILNKLTTHNQAWHSNNTDVVPYGSVMIQNMVKENQDTQQPLAQIATNISLQTKKFDETQIKKVNICEDELGAEKKVVDLEQIDEEEEVQSRVSIIVEENPNDEKVADIPEILKEADDKSKQTRLVKKKEGAKFKKLYDQLKQLSLNFSFLEAVKEMPDFAKCLKGLLTKKKTVQHETKNRDPGVLTIPCSVGYHDFARALCDNGVSINLMPLAIYKQSGLGMPRTTAMRLQMADRSIKKPVGVVDDVLVQVGEFMLPADLVILDYAVDRDIPVILGRSFLSTGRALMDSKKK
ncbi:uncharacterized protein LOC132048719 [Lycium ferocissimum]|uniref:uncharacterized protein LOC132048719 n=1 Tax=Lycium ferocissimum TaxID=112874 RepID=UPI002815A074|nr:uncharacterized protein LOC132048719 [Lycium ferocissimum]